jgi:hypothetical protein
MRNALSICSLHMVTLGILFLASSGCIVIPHPRNIAIARGLQTPKPKLNMIKPGQTTREDMMNLLGHFNTDASQGRFFWARWQQVKVQVDWFAAGCAPSGGCGAGGGSERMWKIQNVLALFDEENSVRYYKLCKESNVISNLQDIVSQIDPPPDVDKDLVLWASHHHNLLFNSRGQGRVIIENGTISFEEPKKPGHNLGLPLSAVERLEVALGSSPEILRLRLKLRQGKNSRNFRLEASPAETLRLVALIKSTR